MADRRTWLAVAVVAACVACELVIVLAPIESLAVTTPSARARMITAILGFAAIAVGVSVVWSMGLGREALGLRVIAAVPIVLSVALVVSVPLTVTVDEELEQANARTMTAARTAKDAHNLIIVTPSECRTDC